MADNVGTHALIAMAVIVLAVVSIVLVLSSRRAKSAWQPHRTKEAHKVSPIALIEDAYSWYVSARQETDPLEALVRTSYGLANLRAVLSVTALESIKGANLPTAAGGPKQLLEKLTAQQAALLALGRQMVKRERKQADAPVEAPAPQAAQQILPSGRGGMHVRL